MWTSRKQQMPWIGLLRRNALDAAQLCVLETDAVTGRRTSIVITEGAILEGASVFEQIKQYLPFEQWDLLELHKYGDSEKIHKTTLYKNDLSDACVGKKLSKCQQILDLERKAEIFSRCNIGYKLVLYKMCAREMHRQFLLSQTAAWMSESM